MLTRTIDIYQLSHW